MKPSSETIYRVLIPVWAANIKISAQHTAVMLYSGILFNDYPQNSPNDYFMRITLSQNINTEPRRDGVRIAKCREYRKWHEGIASNSSEPQRFVTEWICASAELFSEVDPRSTYPRNSASSAYRLSLKKFRICAAAPECSNKGKGESFFEIRNSLYAVA